MMRTLTQILRALLLLTACACVILCTLSGFTGTYTAIGAASAERKGAALQEFLGQPMWYRAIAAAIGAIIGLVASALVLGPIALLFEIRDLLVESRDRLAGALSRADA